MSVLEKIKMESLCYFEGDESGSKIVTFANDNRAAPNSKVDVKNIDTPVHEVAAHFKLPLAKLPNGNIIGVNFENIGFLPLIKKSEVYWIEGDDETCMVIFAKAGVTQGTDVGFPAKLVAAHYGIPMTEGEETFGPNFENVDSIYAAKLYSGGQAGPVDIDALKGKELLSAGGTTFCRTGPPQSLLLMKNGAMLYTCFPLEEVEGLKCQRPRALARTIAELKAQALN